MALAVELKLRDYDEVHITEIQTLVENELMQGPYKALARSYIEYRHDRDVAREKQSKLTKEIEGLIQESNADLLNENANKDGKVIPTQRDLLAGIVAKHYAKREFCHVMWCKLMSRAIFIIMIWITRLSSRCLTAC